MWKKSQTCGTRSARSPFPYSLGLFGTAPQIDSKTPNGLLALAESGCIPNNQSDTKSAQREEKQKGLERLQGAKELLRLDK